MSKNLHKSVEKGLPYKVVDSGKNPLKFTLKNNSNNRRVNTQANQKVDKSELSKGFTKYQFNFNPQFLNINNKSLKKYVPFVTHQKKFSQIKNPVAEPKFIQTLTRHQINMKKQNKQKKDNMETKQSRILKKQQKQLRKSKHLHTEIDQYDNQEKTSQLYKRLTGMSLTKEKVQYKNPQSLYKLVQVIGKGTFGTVYKAMYKQSEQLVAIKKVLQDKRYKNRQLQILKLLHHPNVLQIKDSYFTTQNNQQFLNVVMEYFQESMYSFNKAYIKNFTNIPSILIKIFSYQFFRALNYLNMLSIAHRDIKPHNILVNPHTNRALICDFGSAKQLVKTQSNIAYICSRCYRAPQLIFGATDYTPQIDMWSIGCVIVEMINGQPPFLGDSQIDQLVQIIKVLGTPSKQSVLEMNKDYDLRQYKFPMIKSKQWKKILKPKTDLLLIDLVTKIMQYSPLQRITPFEALCHPYFDELRIEVRYRQIQNKIKCPDLFNFSKDQLNSNKRFGEKLLPVWYKLQCKDSLQK